MKRIIIVLTAVLFWGGILYSQKNAVITFDFKNPTFEPPMKLKPNQSVELVFKNVNPYLYDISIKDTVIVHAIQPPPLFDQVFKIPDLATIVDTSKAEKILDQGSDEDILSQYKALETNIKDIVSLSTIPNNLNKLLYDCDASVSELEVKAKGFIIANLVDIDTALFPIGIQSEIDKKSENIREGLTEFIKKVEKKKEDNIAELKKTKDINEFKQLNADQSLIDKILENSKKLLDKLTEFDKAKIGNAIEEAYNKVKNSRIEIRHLSTTSHDADELEIKVNIIKKKDFFCPKEVPSFTIKGTFIKGVRFKFSTGLVLNLGNKGFFNQKYRYDSVYRAGNVLADSVSIQRNRNNNWLIPSLGVFMHIYTQNKNSDQFNTAIMLGASLGSDQKIYYHIGGSLVFGKNKPFTIGAGISIAGAKILDGQYQEGQIIKRSLAPTSIPTEDAVRLGGFLNFSWRFN